jgi:LuxR family maltose regulon positive regulatory protein
VVALVIPLLTTKLQPPRRRSTAVARPRLDRLRARLDEAPLTLVSAPAGFGKTTLVAEWLADRSPVAWLSLDPRDDDPAVFWAYLVAALGAVAPGAEEASTPES